MLAVASLAKAVPVWYFFMSREDPHSTKLPVNIGRMVHRYESRATAAGLNVSVRVVGYAEGRDMVARVDPELASLWPRVNPSYATVLSNIFRLAALFAHGGIYHDAKCWLPPGPLRTILEVLEETEIVFEERPGPDAVRRPRATNMAAARPGLRYFKSALLDMKAKLNKQLAIEPPVVADHHIIYDIGSHSMLDNIAKHLYNRSAGLKGHLSLGRRCSTCAMPERFHGSMFDNETFVVMPWHVTTEAEIVDAYNKGRERHWSKIHELLFLSSSAHDVLTAAGSHDVKSIMRQADKKIIKAAKKHAKDEAARSSSFNDHGSSRRR